MSPDWCSLRWACGRHAVVALPAEIDANNADQIAGELARFLNERPAVLIVDMTATGFCASAGIHALIRTRHLAAAAGTGLRVAVSTPIVRRMLELTGMDEMLDVYPELNLAVAGRLLVEGRGLGRFTAHAGDDLAGDVAEFDIAVL